MAVSLWNSSMASEQLPMMQPNIQLRSKLSSLGVLSSLKAAHCAVDILLYSQGIYFVSQGSGEP